VAHTYLLDLYRVLTQHRQEYAIAPLGESAEETDLRSGRLAAADEVLAFLRNNYHSRLPRRLQHQALRLLDETTTPSSTGDDT